MSNARNIAGITTDAVNASSELVPVYACRALVNFNGNTTSPYTMGTNRNVTSVTNPTAAELRINFTFDMPNNEYVVCGLAQDNDNVVINELNASYVDVIVRDYQNISSLNTTLITIAVFC